MGKADGCDAAMFYWQSLRLCRCSSAAQKNVSQLLDEVIKKVPEPSIEFKAPLKALIFDSMYDSFKGVIAYVRIVSGEAKKTDRLKLSASKEDFEAARRRNLEERMKYAFVHTYKPVLDDESKPPLLA